MKVKLILCALGLCISLFRAMSGQVASSTTLVGAVTDDSGAVIPNARILAVQDATKMAYKGVTSGTGDYVLPVSRQNSIGLCFHSLPASTSRAIQAALNR
jgi:hypothetical protein